MSTRWAQISFGAVQNPRGIVAGAVGTSSTSVTTTINLNSAYVYGTSGAALGQQFQAVENANLTDVWIYVEGYNGTWSSTDQNIQLEIREGLNGSNKPGTTVTGTLTCNLSGSPTGWVKTSGTIALTAGKLYSLVVSDSDGGATNYVKIKAGLGTFVAFGSAAAQTVRTTTDGFATGGTTGTGALVGCIKVGTRYYGFSGIDARNTVTSNQVERGLKFTPDEDCTVIGLASPTDINYFWSSNYTFKLYDDTNTVPGNATGLLKTWSPVSNTLGGGASMLNELMFAAADHVDLTAGTTYRLVLKPTVSTTTPRKCTILTTGIDTDIKKAFALWNGTGIWTNESGGAWADDDTSVPEFGPIIVPKQVVSAGTPAFAAIG